MQRRKEYGSLNHANKSVDIRNGFSAKQVVTPPNWFKEYVQHNSRSRDGVCRTKPAVVWAHFHVPKTGGTSVANALGALLCRGTTQPLKPEVEPWLQRGTRSCAGAVLDTEFSWPALSLIETLHRREHGSLLKSFSRADAIALNYMNPGKSSYSRIIFVTTLRSSTERVISHWVHCNLALGAPRTPASSPPVALMVGAGLNGGNTIFDRRCELGNIRLWPNLSSSAPPWFSEASLHHFLNHDFRAVPRDHSSWLRVNNAQVGALSSANPHQAPLNSSHLKVAKSALLSGRYSQHGASTSWLIGFADCLSDFFLNLAARFGVPPHVAQKLAAERLEARHSLLGRNLSLPSNALARVARLNSLDTALYRWAKQLAHNSSNDTASRSTELVPCTNSLPDPQKA